MLRSVPPKNTLTEDSSCNRGTLNHLDSSDFTSPRQLRIVLVR
jgi:hypothetical protein